MNIISLRLQQCVGWRDWLSLVKSFAIREFIMSGLLLIDLIDCLAGAGNEFCTDTKRRTTPFRVTRWLFTTSITCIMHALSHSTAAVPRTRYRATDITPAPGIKGDSRTRCVSPLCHNTRARTRCGDRPYASYPHFQPGTRLTVVLPSVLQASSTRLPAARALSSYSSRSFVDYTYFTDLSARFAFICPDVIITLIIPYWARDSSASITVRDRQGVQVAD